MQLQRTRARGLVTVGPLAPVVQQALSSDHQVKEQVKVSFWQNGVVHEHRGWR